MKQHDSKARARAAVVNACSIELDVHLRESHQKRFELQLRLLQLAGGIGVGHHPDARVQPCAVLPEKAESQGYCELPVASPDIPSRRPCVPAPLQTLELVNEPSRRSARPPA